MALVIIKLAGACNLNCSYCYVYNGADQRHLLRPRIMAQDVAKATVDRIFAFAVREGDRNVSLSFHGGEPLLVGKHQDFTHDTKPDLPPGATPYADYLIPIFDDWYEAGNATIRIRTFESIMALLMGGSSRVDAIGGGAVDEMIVEADGSLEPLDVLRACGDGFTYLGLNVLTDELEDLRATPLYDACLNAGQQHAEQCLQCPVFHVCGGGYLPHRFSRALGFANPSVHCADLEKLILHIAGRMALDIPQLQGAR